MHTIKSGRTTYELEDGDTVMDNGACFQLISRKVIKNYSAISPRISKKEFETFKNNSKVFIDTDHKRGSKCTIYIYNKKTKDY